MSFMENLKNTTAASNAQELALTENGATGYARTKSALVDLNFKTASYRQRSDDEIVGDFTKAFSEDANYAFKWAHFARDIREGLGERRLYRVILSNLCATTKNNDSIHSALLWLVNDGAGRWDDVIAITHGTSYWKWAVTEIGKQLEKDATAKNPSLLAKWLPSENTSSKGTRALATEIRTALGKTPRQYRKTLSTLRAKLDVTEVKTSANRWEDIDYQRVPSVANRKYNAAFFKHDADRRTEFLESVEKGEAKINSTANFPHDVYAMYNRDYYRAHEGVDPGIEALWKGLKDMGIENTLVVADGSGSMGSFVSGKISALDVANSLAIYCAEHNKGEFKDKYITFSEHPQFVDFSKATSLLQKRVLAERHNEIANTNVEAVFDLILKTAVAHKTPVDEMPKSILIISDMEFDQATYSRHNNISATLFDVIDRKFGEAGYTLPRLVFWNVNSRTNVIPIQENEAGVALVSGFSVNILKMVMSGTLDPLAVLIEQLNAERYKNLIW